ncbi:uncharacterized protein LOC108671269 [Hyalella azteca]|uniref:Uncharacterized protein LOC108671269 n=1 Tax=Hyalella azteca TaxID=294128 RepID=A0A8B7NKR3_HYAAZ|nr:uncharacterized protein LOC108671269 [Hyalella azteca]XP_018014255.1 uncharacterized protein LOC108671269 [Hyalella azteca]
MEDDGVPTAISSICKVPLSVPAEESHSSNSIELSPHARDGLAVMRGVSAAAAAVASADGSATNFSHDESGYRNQTNIFMSVIRALQEKQRTVGSSEINSLCYSAVAAAASQAHHHNTSYAPSLKRGTSNQPSSPFNGSVSNSQSPKRVNLSRATRDVTPDLLLHSSKRRRGFRDAGDIDFIDMSSSDAPSGKSAGAYISQLSCDIARRHAVSPSSTCSSFSMASSSPGPASFHSEDLASRLSRSYDTNGDSTTGCRAGASPEEDIFNWAHLQMAEQTSHLAAPTPGETPSTTRSSTALDETPARHPSPMPPSLLQSKGSPLLIHEALTERSLRPNCGLTKCNLAQDIKASDDVRKLGISCAAANKTCETFPLEGGKESPNTSVIDAGDSKILSKEPNSVRIETVAIREYPVIMDTELMTVEELLQLISVPKLNAHESDGSKLKEFLDQHEIGHLNHLIKCFSDCIFSAALPDNLVGNTNLAPLDIMDLYCCSVLRLYHLSFKNLDFINLLPGDQISLLENFALKGILSVAFFCFKEESNSWAFPTGLYQNKVMDVKVSELNQILPFNYLQNILTLCHLGAKLCIDWPIGMLLIGAFFYCPVGVEVQDIEKIDKLRDRYMEILFKYLKWKHGPSNASLYFPEILKLMDAVLKNCSEMEEITLSLNNDEIRALEERIETLNTNYVDSGHKDRSTSFTTVKFVDGVTLKKINASILSSIRQTIRQSLAQNVGLDLRQSAAVPTASMYYSNLPLESEEAKSRREVEALLMKRLLLKNHSINSTANCISQSPVRERSKAEGINVEPQTLNPLAIQRLLLNLARADKTVHRSNSDLSSSNNSCQDRMTSPSTMDSLSPSPYLNNHLYRNNALSTGISGTRQIPSMSRSDRFSSHVVNLSEVTITKNSVASRASFLPADENFPSAIDLSKRQRKSSPESVISVRPKAPCIPGLKPLSELIESPKSPPVVVPSLSSETTTLCNPPINFELEERTRLMASALFNEVKKIKASSLESEHLQRETGVVNDASASILTPSQIEILLETLGRSRLRYRDNDP